MKEGTFKCPWVEDSEEKQREEIGREQSGGEERGRQQFCPGSQVKKAFGDALKQTIVIDSATSSNSLHRRDDSLNMAR